MQEPRDRTSEPVDGPPLQPSRSSEGPPADDPYAELENVFDSPIVLEDIPLPPPTTERARSASTEAPPTPPEASAGSDDVLRQIAQRLERLETDARRATERTLEALRRLGERMGSELAQLDKRSINLELTVARLRTMTEALEGTVKGLTFTKAEQGAAPEENAPKAAVLSPKPPVREAGPGTPAQAAIPGPAGFAGWASPSNDIELPDDIPLPVDDPPEVSDED